MGQPRIFPFLPNSKLANLLNFKATLGSFRNVALLLATTKTFPAGSILSVERFGFTYEVAPVIAADHHLTTVGGMKLYVLPDSTASVNLAQMNVEQLIPKNSAWQTLISLCLTTGYRFFVPEGTWTIRSNENEIYLNKGMTADYQGLVMQGAGRGKTIIQEEAGAVTTAETATPGSGRFTTMFYCWLADPATRGYKYGSFHFSDFTLDKNGRSNGPPPTLFEWEGAHMIKFQGGGTPGAGTITASIDAVTFERIELKDKIGAGIVLGPAYCRVRSLVIRDIQSTDHPSIAENGGDYGQKGCIEVAIDSDLTVYEGVNCLYSQIEPTNAYDADRIAKFNLTNCTIATFEFTFLPGANNGLSSTFINAANLTCETAFISRGCHVQLANSRVKVSTDMYDVTFNAINTTFLLPFDPAGVGTVTPMYLSRASSFTFQPYNELVNCKFMIDADTVPSTVIGYGLRCNNTTTLPAVVRIIGGMFDPRLYGVIDHYSTGGDVTMQNVRMAARSGGRAVHAGTFSSFVNRLRLQNCDYSACIGDWIYVQQAATGYSLEVTGDYLASDFKFNSNNFNLVLPAQFPIKPTLWGNAAPTSGMFFAGQRVKAISPAAGGVPGWIATASGSPGTWKAEAVIAA